MCLSAHSSSPLLSVSPVPLRSFALSPRRAPLSSGRFRPHVLAAVVASSLVSPGIRDLRLARCPVSPLIRSQVAPCTVNNLDRLTHDPKAAVMGSREDSGICGRLHSRLFQRPKCGKPFFFFFPPLHSSSANLGFLTGCNKISVSVELISPRMRYTFSLSCFRFHTLPPVTFCTSSSHTPLSSSSVLPATFFVIKNPRRC